MKLKLLRCSHTQARTHALVTPEIKERIPGAAKYPADNLLLAQEINEEMIGHKQTFLKLEKSVLFISEAISLPYSEDNFFLRRQTTAPHKRIECAHIGVNSKLCLQINNASLS